VNLAGTGFTLALGTTFHRVNADFDLYSNGTHIISHRDGVDQGDGLVSPTNGMTTLDMMIPERVPHSTSQVRYGNADGTRDNVTNCQFIVESSLFGLANIQDEMHGLFEDISSGGIELCLSVAGGTPVNCVSTVGTNAYIEHRFSASEWSTCGGSTPVEFAPPTVTSDRVCRAAPTAPTVPTPPPIAGNDGVIEPTAPTAAPSREVVAFFIAITFPGDLTELSPAYQRTEFSAAAWVRMANHCSCVFPNETTSTLTAGSIVWTAIFPAYTASLDAVRNLAASINSTSLVVHINAHPPYTSMGASSGPLFTVEPTDAPNTDMHWYEVGLKQFPLTMAQLGGGVFLILAFVGWFTFRKALVRRMGRADSPDLAAQQPVLADTGRAGLPYASKASPTNPEPDQLQRGDVPLNP
jgi:hypothetical protein